MLAGADADELRLLEVRVDPHALQRHQGGDARARRDIGTGLDRLVADDAVERRPDHREGDVALGPIDGGAQLGGQALGLALLGMQNLHIRFGRDQAGLGTLHRRIPAVAVGLGLVEARFRDVIGLHLRRAIVVGERTHGVGLGGVDLRGHLRDLGLGGLRLPTDPQDGALLRRELVLRRLGARR